MSNTSKSDPCPLEGYKLGAPSNYEGYRYPPKDWGVVIHPMAFNTWHIVAYVILISLFSGTMGYLLTL